ncbi:MAG: hypothetical protein ACR2PT_14400 [Endozoicomonas sp.]
MFSWKSGISFQSSLIVIGITVICSMRLLASEAPSSGSGFMGEEKANAFQAQYSLQLIEQLHLLVTAVTPDTLDRLEQYMVKSIGKGHAGKKLHKQLSQLFSQLRGHHRQALSHINSSRSYYEWGLKFPSWLLYYLPESIQPLITANFHYGQSYQHLLERSKRLAQVLTMFFTQVKQFPNEPESVTRQMRKMTTIGELTGGILSSDNNARLADVQELTEKIRLTDSCHTYCWLNFHWAQTAAPAIKRLFTYLVLYHPETQDISVLSPEINVAVRVTVKRFVEEITEIHKCLLGKESWGYSMSIRQTRSINATGTCTAEGCQQ